MNPLNFDGFLALLGMLALFGIVPSVVLVRLIDPDDPRKYLRSAPFLVTLWFYSVSILGAITFWIMDKDSGKLGVELVERLRWNFGEGAVAWYYSNFSVLPLFVVLLGLTLGVLTGICRFAYDRARAVRHDAGDENRWVRVSIALCALCLIFPPVGVRETYGRFSNVTYKFLLTIPEDRSIEYTRLFIQFALITAGSYGWLRRRN